MGGNQWEAGTSERWKPMGGGNQLEGEPMGGGNQWEGITKEVLGKAVWERFKREPVPVIKGSRHNIPQYP